MKNLSLPALIALTVLLLVVAVLLNGFVLYVAWSAFALNELVELNYLQATGIALILSMFTFPSRLGK